MSEYVHYLIETTLFVVGFLLKKEHSRITQDSKYNAKQLSILSESLTNFRDEVYKYYPTKSEFSDKLDKIERSLERIQEYLLKHK